MSKSYETGAYHHVNRKGWNDWIIHDWDLSKDESYIIYHNDKLAYAPIESNHIPVCRSWPIRLKTVYKFPKTHLIMCLLDWLTPICRSPSFNHPSSSTICDRNLLSWCLDSLERPFWLTMAFELTMIAKLTSAVKRSIEPVLGSVTILIARPKRSWSATKPAAPITSVRAVLVQWRLAGLV